MKKLAYILGIFMTIFIAFAFLGTDYIIKFDDEKSGMIRDDEGFGCSTQGRVFFRFTSADNLNTDNIELTYIDNENEEKSLTGTFYKRDNLGFFKTVDRLREDTEYYFFSDSLFDGGTYEIKLNNLDALSFPNEFDAECPEFRYSCDDFKPRIDTCYNTEDEKLIIEFSNANIDENEVLGLQDLFIHTSGNNEFVDEADNVLAEDAVLEKISDDKYRITSTILKGDYRKPNIIDTVYFQPRACFLDMYKEAYTYGNCEGIKEASAELVVEDTEEETPEVTGAATTETESSGILKYWILGFFVAMLIGVFYWKRK